MHSSLHLLVFLLSSSVLPYSLANTIGVQAGEDSGLEDVADASKHNLPAENIRVRRTYDPNEEDKPQSSTPNLTGREAKTESTKDPATAIAQVIAEISRSDSIDDSRVRAHAETAAKALPRPIDVKVVKNPTSNNLDNSGDKKKQAGLQARQESSPERIELEQNAATSESPSLSRRKDGDITLLLALERVEKDCAYYLRPSSKAPPKRSVKLDRRVDYRDPHRENPGNVLYDAPNICKIIDMNFADYLPWNDGNWIGTVGLCGCTAAAIVGEYGAIVAHINPNPAYFVAQMDKIHDLYFKYLYGKPFVAAYVFAPAINGKIEAPILPEGVLGEIAKWGITALLDSYEMYTAGAGDENRLGSMLVQKAGTLAYTWINNKLVGYPHP